PEGISFSFADTAGHVSRLAEQYAATGYRRPHRIGLLLANRPEHMLHKLAMQTLGICCVPINPDYRPAGRGYLVEHARLDLSAVLAAERGRIDEALAESRHQPAIVNMEAFSERLPVAARRREGLTSDAQPPASILSTSGTTGRH